MKKSILLTGATGFLGTQIARKLLSGTDYHIFVLVRGENKDSAVNRLYRAWWEFPELIKAIGERVSVLKGDISEEHLGLEKNDYEKLGQQTTHIIHAAADIRLDAALEDLKKTNVQGTKNLLELAYFSHKDHGLERFSYVSTAYVAGRRQGEIREDSLTGKCGFLSNYEKSKYEGELLVRSADLPVSIFRPGMVVGDSRTGYIKTFNTVYTVLRLYMSGKLKIMPVQPSLRINMVPVDYVAGAVTDLTFNDDAEGLTFHLTAPYDSLPTAEELVKSTQKWAREKLGIKLPHPLFIPISSTSTQKLISLVAAKTPASYRRELAGDKLEISATKVQMGSRLHLNQVFFISILRLFSNKTKGLLNIITTLAPYFGENRQFLRENTDKLLGPYELNWQDFLPKILEFAVYHGFFHRSERTVHEQVLFRLKSRSRPVKYYDIVDHKFTAVSGDEMYQDILAAARSLRKLGIKKGDRVALVGFNSARYLTIDAAIGLSGAISVPLYYTSPINEINEILKDSGAKIVFIGTSELLNKANEPEDKIPVISFCGKTAYLPSGVIDWHEFLGCGDGEENQPTAPVNFNDIATIRYTSGTTGKPRGAVFTHGNLRWMAEFIASMLPWKDRNSEITYLSFLPMNHVVEGILGTYAPYYAPAPLKLYFLEDFRGLHQALPEVRPKIFFSVPRFYEKVYEGLTEKKIWRLYVNSKNGLFKTMLQRLIRGGILKKTGLDRCAQLIVGSAPVSEELLREFHDLAIEIHNAYGLTEAPLVTINRLGQNKIGTVGEPLPLTKIRIASDGEILVKGPQVTQGYFNKNLESIFKDEWLRTGDFGRLTQGYLVIDGRKKEIIINSYGKSITPSKIESRLKNISGITEAMLIGDEKPYCTALLWIDSEKADIKAIDRAIRELNSQLSNPEKIKRWAVLGNDLSIKNGDLTANLKLKRKAIIKRYHEVMDCLYEHKANYSEPIIYVGSAGRKND